MTNSACERRKGVYVWSKCERRNLFCALCEGEWGCLKYYRLLTILIFFCALADPHEIFFFIRNYVLIQIKIFSFMK